MKSFIWFSFPVLMIVCIISACSPEQEDTDSPIGVLDFDTIDFQPSMKGWELYSWPVRDNYCHSLLQGTNRIKSYNEVIHNDYVVFGTDSLKMLLACLPEGESIFWLGRDWLERCWGGQPYGELTVPVPDIVDEIEDFCSDHGLDLSVADH